MPNHRFKFEPSFERPEPIGRDERGKPIYDPVAKAAFRLAIAENKFRRLCKRRRLVDAHFAKLAAKYYRARVLAGSNKAKLDAIEARFLKSTAIYQKDRDLANRLRRAAEKEFRAATHQRKRLQDKAAGRL